MEINDETLIIVSGSFHKKLIDVSAEYENRY